MRGYEGYAKACTKHLDPTDGIWVVSGPSVEAIGELICVRRGAPRIEQLGEARIGRMEFVASQRERSPVYWRSRSKVNIVHPVFRFNTEMFDVTQERRNDINPIYGESLLVWLAERAKGTAAVSLPSSEDWGWYADVTWEGRSYMLGASASKDQNGATEWVLQIVKHRSLGERLLGKEKMTADDDCLAFFRQLIESEPSFLNLSVE